VADWQPPSGRRLTSEDLHAAAERLRKISALTEGLPGDSPNDARLRDRLELAAVVKDRSDAGWHFTFLGANQDAIQAGEGIGVGAASAMSYAGSPAGARGATSSLSASIGRVRSGADRTLAYTEEERRRSG
jgi:hypothetical protein